MHGRHLKRFMRGGRRGGGWDRLVPMSEFGRGHHHRRGGGGRMFEHGDLRLVVMALLGDQSRHGYEIMKEIEAQSGGAYAPSPGVIYPLLTMLEEMGLAELEAGEGSKKLYALTLAGHDELAAKRGDAEALLKKLASVKERFSGGRSPQIVRAMENLKLALRLRMERGPLSETDVQNVAAAIDAAAQAIERS